MHRNNRRHCFPNLEKDKNDLDAYWKYRFGAQTRGTSLEQPLWIEVKFSVSRTRRKRRNLGFYVLQPTPSRSASWSSQLSPCLFIVRRKWGDLSKGRCVFCFLAMRDSNPRFQSPFVDGKQILLFSLDLRQWLLNRMHWQFISIL